MSRAPLPLPVLHATHAGFWLLEAGEAQAREASRGEAIGRLAETPHILLNAPVAGQRLGYGDVSGLDLLELFAFVHPARFAVPTVDGMARAVGLAEPTSDAEATALLRQVAEQLLAGMADKNWPEREGAWSANQTLWRLGWGWGPFVAERLQKPERGERMLFSRLGQWEESGERPAPLTVSIPGDDAEARLESLTGSGSETRAGQRAMARESAAIFAPRPKPGEPNMLLAEAGTGIGKTLAYLAPASLWAERAGGTVWISTFTKALQRQLDGEGWKIVPDADARKKRIVIRKGRENYLCLLNLEDAMQGGFSGRAAILAHLVGRWAAYSKDGDMVGGDLPGWLPSLFRRAGATALTDRRGECVYAGCPHYRKCFIEKAERAGREADLVIANHALVMVNAARGRPDAPSRIVFDEGHHLFDAADSTFSAALTGREAIELRRWIVGPENKSRGRRRGLAARLLDVASYDDKGGEALEAAVEAARALPSEGWLSRIAENDPFGPVERVEGREYDVGLHRHWLDPTRPLAKAVLEPAHGVLVTSATLRGSEDWARAEERTGAAHLARPASRFEAASPFDYSANSEVLIATDVARGDTAALAGAYARLIEASGGGTLGLFTAIARLRSVHARIADRLARAGLPLYAQHVDPIDTGTLVDIFRDDPHASLLGTDALRDGVDVPGESLRLVVMERVPWPRPTVLHAARRLAGGGSAYDDRVVRARLAQAFGRLIRRQGDFGSFVVLSSAFPSRLLSAFPQGVAVHRLPIDEVVERVRARSAGNGSGETVAKLDESPVIE